MSESLTIDLWEREPEEVKDHWRGVVAKRASLTMGMDGGSPTAPRSIEARYPEAAAKALYLLGETDKSKTSIAKECGFNYIQLSRLAMANAPTLEQRRPELAKAFTKVAEQTLGVIEKRLERIMESDELMDSTPLNHLAILAGVATDKAGGLSNVPTSSIEVKIGVTIEDAMKVIEAAKAKVKEIAVEAEVIS